MEESRQKKRKKGRSTEIRTFSVPFTIDEVKDKSPSNLPSKSLKEQLINKAINFHLEGKIDKAEQYYQLCLNQGLTDHRVFSNYGLILKGYGKLKEAEIFTRKAIELNPNCAEAYSNLGTILNDLGKRQEAIKEWIKSVKLKPEREQLVKTLALNLCLDRKYELALNYLSKTKSNYCQSLYLGCLLSLDKEQEFTKKYQKLYRKMTCNACIGGIVEHANIIYKKKYDSPFCNKAINYILIERIDEEFFSNNDLNQLISLLRNKQMITRDQGILCNGIQTSGNLFSLNYPYIKLIKKVLRHKIELYREKYKDSGQGFINNWPQSYELRSWMIGMKNGGFLKPHNHEYGWITGSFYLQIPKYNNNNNHSGDIAFSYKGPQFPEKDMNFNLTIKKIKTRDICIFPSSLFHHTIPFESTEDRICFVFDLVQK